MKELMAYMKTQLELKDYDLKTYSPLVLAYIGDIFYDLIIKTKIVTNGNAPVNNLHRRCSNLVKAKTQATIMKYLIEELTLEEEAVYKRGRNAKSGSNPKSSSVTEYRIATGLEALIGYLYLDGQYERVIDLVRIGLEKLEAGSSNE
ncbi:ribonuclease-3 family protein [Natranaerovirga pectinivora]|uniref:Mini-ribonuclease 3 n=1 Tax=Natranaerovirga pectinivora TaxID=682400 RepID=A0A4R3MLZ4_9FIRM|nr:ribonuclease III domain-containing protein [Natranaerovirga pectinivora]TCT15726.1 ribonuclease-3 family protein [Natranaerovirga pectinivora]